MKTFTTASLAFRVSLLLSLITLPVARAQEMVKATSRGRGVFQQPHLPEGGGQMALVQAIQQRAVYPQKALRYGLQGQGSVIFAVAPDGRIRHIRMRRSIEPDIDTAVVAAVRQLPRLVPGTQRGRSVACLMEAPVTFALSDPRPVWDSMPPAADSTQLYTAVEEMPRYHNEINYTQLAADLEAEYLRLRGNKDCTIPRLNLAILVTVGPSGHLYNLKMVGPDSPGNAILRAEYGTAVLQAEEPEFPPACLALLTEALQHLPSLAPAYANGQRVAMQLQLTLLAPQP